MNIKIVCIGKLKEAYWVAAISEYTKRLNKYCSLTIDELKEERCSEKPSEAEISMVKELEGKSILKQCKKDSYIIALEIKGKSLSSEELAQKVQQLAIAGKSDVNFIIGGSWGLSEEVLTRADFRLSFSKMTFPHQMMRIILLEQIYRSFKIIKNETYHK